MKTSNLRHETRDGVLIGIASDMIARTNMTKDGFAEALNAALHDMAPHRCEEHQGYPSLNAMAKTADVNTYSRAYKTWCKRVERWFGEEVEIPAWIEESWVAALEQPWRERALRELAARYGLLAVRPVGSGAMDALHAFAGISTNFGHVAGIGGEVFADGVFNHLDIGHAESFESYCRALAANCISMADRAAEIKAKAH